MREKIILQDFTVLLVCVSTGWSTVERRVLFDSTFLRNIKCNPVVLCVKGSQIDLAAEREDIARVYITKRNLDWGVRFFFELRSLILENRYDIVHCYSLTAIWSAAFILRSQQKTPLFLTFNQNIVSIYHNVFVKWLLRRVDYIFTLCEDTQEFVQESFRISNQKIKSLGCGLEVYKGSAESREVKSVGCVINDVNEVKRLKYIVRVFRILKNEQVEKFSHLQLYVFLGPAIYQKNSAKKILTELEHEFYKGDILLYSLETKKDLLKDLDIYLGTAFDEPLNDYELTALIQEIPVLFPRTAMRQSLLFKYLWGGESYYEGDIREAKSKLLKILNNYPLYKSALRAFSDEITSSHGLDHYAENLQKYYEKAFAKRMRFRSSSH
ncbi:MAG: glycosyltransferase [Halobacteriovoraceae bacterium]|jgi:glycosyltransferase involved in cell wall biosynthesis|nr:glycosyltransferase [Halobacteriovoraceae bacterium]